MASDAQLTLFGIPIGLYRRKDKSYALDTANGSATRAVAITPSDSTDLSEPTRGLYVGASGNVTVTLEDDTTQQTFVGLAVGVVHPLKVKRVWSTGTTATSIIGVM